MTCRLGTPDADGLEEVLGALREWQRDGAPFQLHPGDVGWYWRRGTDATAAALRTWRRDGRLVAVGMLDGPDLLRLGFGPDAHRDPDLARQLMDDLTADDQRVLPGDEACVEAPPDALVHDLLGEAGWQLDEPWALLRRDLDAPVEDPELRVVVVGPDEVDAWCAVHFRAFGGSSDLTAADLRERWLTMSGGLPYVDARSLLGIDTAGNPVAAVTVWSAGPGRLGVIEPMGVHPDHRGAGHGRAISLAAAAALRELGSSAALVCAPVSNAGAVATYVSAGMRQVGLRRDRCRADD